MSTAPDLSPVWQHPVHQPNPWPALPERPWLPPVLRRVWRAPGVLQIGTDPDTAIVLTGIDPVLYELLTACDGSKTTAELVDGAIDRGASRSTSVDLIRHLFSAGCVVDVAPEGLPAIDPGPLADPSLLPEYAGRSLATPGSCPPLVAARRKRASVVIHGGRRLGSVLASLLAAAGVGRVSLVDRAAVEPADVIPGGAGLVDVGHSRQDVAAATIRRLRSDTITAAPDSLSAPTLVVITEPWPEPYERERMLRLLGAPYLFAAVRERRAVVGPFVIPGRTSCLRCQHLHRRDRDPAWEAVAAQLQLAAPHSADAGEASLAVLAASLTAMQALHWVDDERTPASCDATLEFVVPEFRIQRRRWVQHPRCPCGTYAD